LGLLVEEQRSNLELQSNAFSTSPWFTTGTIARSQDVIGPDGLISAWTITDNDASALSSVIQDVTISNDAATRVGSIYIRKTSGATTFPGVGVSAFGGTSVNQFYTINTNTGVAIARNTNTGIGSCSVRDFGAFWRVEITNTNNSTGNTGLRVSLFPAVNTDGGADWTVAPTGSVVFYGAQLEAGAFATSYIPTAASTVTRSVDVASVATSQFPYGITDGSFIVSYSLVGFSTTSILASLNDGTPNNVIEHIVNSSTQNVWRVRVGGTNQTSEVSTTASGINKVGGVYNNNYFASTANGATVVLDTSGSIPTGISQLNIGNRAAVNSICGHIRQITYLPRRITNSELQQRTS
jgi:hypothetical protein